MIKSIIHFFDKLEDHIRHYLSKTPIIYAAIGGVAVVLFWRSVWELADQYDLSAWSSLAASIIIMMATGTFVSFFIGEQILMSGLKEEKRIDQKTENEIEEEEARLQRMVREIDQIRRDVEQIKEAVAPKGPVRRPGQEIVKAEAKAR
jgi:uncharacterized membrane protein YcjF (UPF0283 family)